MNILHNISTILGLSQATRTKLMAQWRRISHWLPDYYYPTNSYGLNEEPRNKKITVSLTSYPGRIKTVAYTIETILNQTVKPDRLVLWLGEEKFPNKEYDLPQNLKRLFNFGLTIGWTRDIRSYTKLIPAVKAYPNDIIITVDDDNLYQPFLIEKLIESYKVEPAAAHTFIGPQILVNADGTIGSYNDWKYDAPPDTSYSNITLGAGGMLYPPHCHTEELFNESNFKLLAPTTDDLWFWAMTVLAGRKIHRVMSGLGSFYPCFFANQASSLWSKNIDSNNGNDKQLASILETYPIVKQRLMGEIE